jgi:hypothetical protein
VLRAYFRLDHSREYGFGDREALSRYFSLRSVIVLLLQARTVAL